MHYPTIDKLYFCKNSISYTYVYANKWSIINRKKENVHCLFGFLRRT